MAKRIATAGLMAVFLSTLVCAVVCPEGSLHVAGHTCDMPDHSCCPPPNDDGALRVSQCLDTHFVGESKFEHAAPKLIGVIVHMMYPDHHRATARHAAEGVDSFTPPPPDILIQQHVQRA